jgi:hypothetical protein
MIVTLAGYTHHRPPNYRFFSRSLTKHILGMRLQCCTGLATVGRLNPFSSASVRRRRILNTSGSPPCRFNKVLFQFNSRRYFRRGSCNWGRS